jgi:hypothetical protein
MADMYKLASRSGMISSGAAGFLKGVANRQKEDRESQASREKDALAAFVQLSKEGWTKADESKGIPSGEGIQLEGFGILVPPPVTGVSDLDIASAIEKRAQAGLHEATADWMGRRPGEEAKGLVTWSNPADRTDQIQLPPGQVPPKPYIKHDTEIAPQGLVSWVDRNNPKSPVLKRKPGVTPMGPPGSDYVQYKEYTDLEVASIEKTKEELKDLRAKSLNLISQIGRDQTMIDLITNKKNIDAEDKSMLDNRRRSQAKAKETLKIYNKRFYDLVGSPLANVPSPISTRRATSDELDAMIEELKKTIKIDGPLSSEQLNEFNKKLEELAKQKGLEL